MSFSLSAALFGVPWHPEQSFLKSLTPAIKFSSVGAMGFGICGAWWAAAASSAMCAKADSQRDGRVFELTGSMPSRATHMRASGSAKSPSTNPTSTLPMASLLDRDDKKVKRELRLRSGQASETPACSGSLQALRKVPHAHRLC